MTDMLRKKIKDNPNLTDEFKCNLGTLTDSLLGIFPDYDYTYLMDKLSALKVSKSNTIAGYSSYNNNDNEFNSSSNENNFRYNFFVFNFDS